MKRIGIVTLHFYENFGSVLQAYALQKKIQQLLPEATVEIVNYVPGGLRYNYFSEPDLQKRYELKRELFDLFRKDDLGITSEEFSEEKLDLYNGFDYLITGSDQVWNPEITKLDPAYFLGFASEKSKRISYAASLAVNKNHPQMSSEAFKEFLPLFDFISIREKVHEEYIQSFTDTEVTTVVDPTMLLTREDYLPIISKESLCDEPFLLMYFLTHDPNVVDMGNMLAIKFGLKIVHYFADMPDRLFHGDSDEFSFVGPKEFLWYLDNADLVFTNSFHGTVFSILFQTPFYTYTAKREMLSRVIYLTEMLGLEDRRLPGYMNPNEFSLEVDWKSVEALLQPNRNHGTTFLTKALDVEK